MYLDPILIRIYIPNMVFAAFWPLWWKKCTYLARKGLGKFGPTWIVLVHGSGFQSHAPLTKGSRGRKIEPFANHNYLPKTKTINYLQKKCRILIITNKLRNAKYYISRFEKSKISSFICFILVIDQFYTHFSNFKFVVLIFITTFLIWIFNHL